MQSIKCGMLLASAASLMLLSACSADKDAKPVAAASKEPIAATVNGTPITQKTVDMVVKQAVHSGQPDTPETRKAIIDRLALQAVIAQEAIAKGLDKTPEVTEQIDTAKQTVLANAYVQDLVKNSTVTDDMVKAEYERIKATITGTEYKARHILVEKESEAKEIIATLKKDPRAFEKLAKEKSKDQGSRANGGELGWFDPSRMVPEFGAAVTKLEKGKFTQVPVKTQYGYHVILLEDSRPIEAPPIEEVKAQLSQQLQQQNVIKQLDALKTKAKIEVVGAASSAAPAPAASVPK
jgi:peptidyl-prolyl cis-trans isomerase C